MSPYLALPPRTAREAALDTCRALLREADEFEAAADRMQYNDNYFSVRDAFWRCTNKARELRTRASGIMQLHGIGDEEVGL